MNNVIGIINNTRDERQLKEIIYGRSMAAVPYGGRYRMIDFTLSNMINSGIQNAGILVQKNYRSLLGHIRSPKEWDLDRKRDGLFILPPDYEKYPYGVTRGDLEILYSNLDYIARSKQEYVIISGVNMVCNINYDDALRFHQKNENDITVIYKKVMDSLEDYSRCSVIKIDGNGRILDMQVNPSMSACSMVSMEMYIMKKSLLVDMTCNCISRGEYDLVKDGIIKNINKLKVYGYEFEGYLANINSIKSFYRHNMELLNPDIWKELFFESGYIYTKARDQATAKYLNGAVAKNSLVANGCVISGNIENSILFRAVRIKKGARVKNSIIMQNCEIQEDVILENVILDKDSIITKGRHLVGSKEYPIVIEKKVVV